jgi:choline dehydrogenase-like flavoprotein
MDNSTKQYDAVIVGGGWAGSALAYRLASANKKVLVLEAGIAIDGLVTNPDENQLVTGNRAEFMDAFFMAMAKTPESPYVQNYNAPRPSVLDINPVPPFKLTQPPPPDQADLPHLPEPAPPPAAIDCTDVKKSIDNGYFIQRGPIPFGSTYERRGGGTSWHWLGTSLRMLPNEFEIGVSADVGEQAIHGITFSEGYVYPMAKIPATILDNTIQAGVGNLTFDGSSLKVTGTPAGRNGVPNQMKDGTFYDNGRRQCQGNTNCTPICPIQAKYDATVTMAKALMTGNVDIIYQAVATNVLLDMATNEVNGIEYKTYETTGGPCTGTFTATGTKYIIAAHAIEAAKLLLMSNTQIPAGVANVSGQVGKNLMDHPMYLGWGLMPTPVYPFRGPLSTSGIEGTRDGAFRSNRASFRIEIGNEGWNWPGGAPYAQVIDMVSPMPPDGSGAPTAGTFGSALRQNIQSTFTHQFRIGFLIEQLPDDNCYIVPSKNCMDNLGVPRPEIYYQFDDYTMEGFKAAAAATEFIFNALNVKDFTGIPVGSGGAFVYDGVTYYPQGAGHVMGTHRMGFTKDDSVTDANMKSWDHNNLYIVGCGSMPTTATSNPTLTMMALAFKAADAILASFN